MNIDWAPPKALTLQLADRSIQLRLDVSWTS